MKRFIYGVAVLSLAAAVVGQIFFVDADPDGIEDLMQAEHPLTFYAGLQ